MRVCFFRIHRALLTILDPNLVVSSFLASGFIQSVSFLIAYAVILVSSELPEVMHLAHRVIVMRRGRMASEFAMGQADAETVVAAASGLELPARSAATAPQAVPDELLPMTLKPELAA